MGEIDKGFVLGLGILIVAFLGPAHQTQRSARAARGHDWTEPKATCLPAVMLAHSAAEAGRRAAFITLDVWV